MKVLILHQHFNTPGKGGPLRSYYLAKALVETGLKPIVITAHNQKTHVTEFLEGIEVHYLPVAYDNSFGFYKRILSFINYMRLTISMAKRFKDVKLVYAISVPLTVGLAAMRIKAKYKIPYLFEVGDLWPDAPIQLGFIKNKILQAIAYKTEKSIYERARAVVALSEPIKDGVLKKVPGKQVPVIPNMADTEYYQTGIRNELREKYSLTGKFVVSYVGAVGFANGLDYFLSCARVAQKAKMPVHFIICGEGAMKANLVAFAKTLSLENISFLPFANREMVREIMQVTDACFVCYRPEKILETGSPNKYFDGLAGGKPVIINFGGWIKEEIERYNCGIALNPNSPEEFVAKVGPLVNDPNHTLQLGLNARKLAEEKYSREILSEKFVNIIRLNL